MWPALRLTKAWTVGRSNPCGGEIFRVRPDWHRGPPGLLYNGYRVLLGSGGADIRRGNENPPFQLRGYEYFGAVFPPPLCVPA